MRFLLLLILICLGPAAVTAETGAAPSGLRLNGGFIQYQDWMMKLDSAAWRKEIDALRRARMNLIVVQWLRENRTEFIPSDPKAVDPTEEILGYADAHAMKVFVGLTMDDAWWNRWMDAGYLDRAAAESVQVAEKAWVRYGKHPSFAGWYVPQEMWDGAYDEGQIDRLRGFFHRVSARCKALSGNKPVATAPFFEHNTPPKAVERIYSRFLNGAGIDILMLQDGVGARGWDEDVAGHTVPYFRAFHNACLANGVALWSDLESFRLAGKQSAGFIPADSARIGRQLAAEAPFVRRFVTFDFFHYLSPYRGAAQERLYRDYLRGYVDREFVPAYGRSVEIDPLFPYYQGRTSQSIASEIRANGYDIVHYILTADSNFDPALLKALHEAGMGVWYATFANGTYSTKDLPAGWREWKMVTRQDLEGKPLDDGYTRLCLNNPNYRAWKKRQIALMLREHPFEGVDIMEPHWPEYPGPESPDYACFCAHCRAAFHRMFPEETALPDILHPNSPQSPGRNPALWRKWLAFRKASLTDFLNDLVNGPGGIRKSAPQTKVCVWTLALSAADGVRRVREDSGEDAAEIARVVKPDLCCLQTHWPDWTRADLPPDYVQSYRPFITAIRAAAPDMPLMIQADVGSQPQNRRDWQWIEAFERACAGLGVGSATYYEYFIGGYMDTDPPRIADVQKDGNKVTLVFTKRLDPASASDLSRYTLHPGGIAVVHVDGNLVTLSLSESPQGEPYTLTVQGIIDAADKRLFHDRPTAVLASQTIQFR